MTLKLKYTMFYYTLIVIIPQQPPPQNNDETEIGRAGWHWNWNILCFIILWLLLFGLEESDQKALETLKEHNTGNQKWCIETVRLCPVLTTRLSSRLGRVWSLAWTRGWVVLQRWMVDTLYLSFAGWDSVDENRNVRFEALTAGNLAWLLFSSIRSRIIRPVCVREHTTRPVQNETAPTWNERNTTGGGAGLCTDGLRRQIWQQLLQRSVMVRETTPGMVRTRTGVPPKNLFLVPTYYSTCTLEGIRVLGATMWSSTRLGDFNAWLTTLRTRLLGQQIRKVFKIRAQNPRVLYSTTVLTILWTIIWYCTHPICVHSLHAWSFSVCVHFFSWQNCLFVPQCFHLHVDRYME